jgi:hypothetical protein
VSAPSERIASAFTRTLLYREAIASVSLSHPQGCRCLTCRAAGGDDTAFAELMLVLKWGEDQRAQDVDHRPDAT